MIIWEGTRTASHFNNLTADIEYSQRGPLGLEVLIEEETKTQVIFKVNLYSNVSTIVKLCWGFNWSFDSINSLTSDRYAQDYFRPLLRDKYNSYYYDRDLTYLHYYNRMDNIEYKEVNNNIWLIDTTYITVDKPKNNNFLYALAILQPQYQITTNNKYLQDCIFDTYIPFGFRRDTNIIKIYYNKGVVRETDGYWNFSRGLNAYPGSSIWDWTVRGFDANAYFDSELCGTYYKTVGSYKTIYPEQDGLTSTTIINADGDIITLVDFDGDGKVDIAGYLYHGDREKKYIITNNNAAVYGYNSKRDGTGEEFAPEFTYKRDEDIELYPDLRPLPNWVSAQRDGIDIWTERSLVYYLDLNYEPESLSLGNSHFASIGILQDYNTKELRYFLARGGAAKYAPTRHEGSSANAYEWNVLRNVDKMFGLHPKNKHFKEWNTKPDGTGVAITNENIADFYTAWSKHYQYKSMVSGNGYWEEVTSMQLIDLVSEVNHDPDKYSYCNVGTTHGDWVSATKDNINSLANNVRPFETVTLYRYRSPEVIFEGYVYDGMTEDITYLTQNGNQELINLSEIGEFMRPVLSGNNAWENTYKYYEPLIDLRGLHPSHIYWDFTAGLSDANHKVACRLYAIWEPDESIITLDNHLVLEDEIRVITEKADYNGKTTTTLEDAYNYYTTVASGQYALNQDFGYEITDTRYTGIVEFIPFSRWLDKDFDPFNGVAADYEITLYRQYTKQVKPTVTFGEATSFTKTYDELFSITLSDEELNNIVGPGATVKYWQDQYGNKYGVGTPNNFYIPAEENRHLTLTPMVVGKNYATNLILNGESAGSQFTGIFTFGIENLNPYYDKADKKVAEKLVNYYNNILNKKIKGWKVNDNDLIYDLTLALASNTDYTNPINLNLVLAEKTKNIVEFYDGDEHKFDLAVYSDDTYDEWCVGNLFNVKRFYKNGYIFDGVTLDGVKFIDKNFKIIADTVLFDIDGKSHVDEDDTIETYRVQIQWKWAPGVVIKKKNYTCHICINGEFKEVLPYIYHEGRWQIATYDWRGA